MTKFLKYKGYTGTLEVDIEDNLLYGVIEFITDIVSYSAATPSELEKEFKDAVNDYIETCNELQREPQKPFSGTFNVRIGSDLHKKAAIQSKVNGVSLNVLVKYAITEYLDTSNEKIVHHIHKVESQVSEPVIFNFEENISTNLIGVESWTQSKIAFQKQH